MSPMTNERKGFDLGDYVEVKDRIRIFYELYPQGRLVTGEVRLSNEPDGIPRVMVQGLAYRSPDDPLPGVGWSWMTLPGTSNYTRGSEIENTETSAWGRAIGSLGILIDRSIASAQEVQNKTGGDYSATSNIAERAARNDLSDGSLIGTIELGKSPVDLSLRQTPDGPAFGFKLKAGSKAFQVLAIGPLAEALAIADLEVGTTATCWGPIVMVPWEKAGQKMPPFARVTLERISTPDFTLPATEAVPEPLWTDVMAEVDAVPA